LSTPSFTLFGLSQLGGKKYYKSNTIGRKALQGFDFHACTKEGNFSIGIPYNLIVQVIDYLRNL
jgi:hypothetical protein